MGADQATLTSAAPVTIPRLLGVAILGVVALVFASNHVAARLAFDHGVSVAAAVTARSIATAVAVLVLIIASGTRIPLDSRTVVRGLGVGLLLTVQSYCLYSAVARLPVALALLTFNTFPLLLALISWRAGGERPTGRTLAVMAAIGIGLVLALDLFHLHPDPRRTAIGAGVAFGLTAAFCFAAAIYLTSRWLGRLDGRMRSVLTMGTVGVVTLLFGAWHDSLAWPVDREGWIGLTLLCLLYGTAITVLFIVLPRLGPVNSAPVLNVEPVAAMGLSWLLLGQRLAPTQVLGALIVVAAVISLALLPARRPA
jgi:drug/metabolite transporter (DMT)-like permease